MKIVIGSGPAGIACTHALLVKGEQVTMLDAGIALEKAPQDLLAKIKGGDDSALEQLKNVQSHIPISGKGVSLKLTYGSDFPYRDVGEHLGFEGVTTGLAPSLALGGFSNVWGAAALPYRQRDIADWPITERDLAPHYKALLGTIGLAGRNDDLATMFPLYSDKPEPLRLSSQAEKLFSGLQGMRGDLLEEGIRFGASRLIVGPNKAHNQSCVYCGQCLYGCPHGCIYNSADDVRHLIATHGERFTYRPNVIVETVSEGEGRSRISGYDRVSNAPLVFESDRTFLAAGVIPSTRIMLKSAGAYDHPLTIKDSQYFILPIVSSKSGGYVSEEALHTLSQLFLEIEDETISPYTIHLQVYTYNDLLGKVLRKKLWFAPGLREPVAGFLQRRMLVIQGYLHSDHSGSMTLNLTRDAATGKERLRVQGFPGAETKEKVQQIIRKIAKPFSKLGLFSISQGVDITHPGRGFHSGGSLPMRANPGAFETDVLGRLPGHERTHVVDASIFPSIPATTITLTSMANAHRIGSIS